MPKSIPPRASPAAIFERLQRLIGPEAVNEITDIVALLDDHQNAVAIQRLVTLDEKIGGYFSIPAIGPKLPGVYRPLRYITFTLEHPAPREMARFLVAMIGQYLENLLQRLNLIGALGKISDNLFPMGRLVRLNESFLPKPLYVDLQWFASEIYNHAKHSLYLEDQPVSKEQPHYFELDEALALCLIARKLAVQLEQLSGKTREELMAR